MHTLHARVVRTLAFALLFALTLQVYFAGAFVFGALSVEWHRRLGMLIALGALLTALLSLATRATRANAGKHWAFVGGVALQVVLILLRPKFPAISALHVPNTGLLMALAKRAASGVPVPMPERTARVSRPSRPSMEIGPQAA